jgi:hypothetical protein
MARTGQSQDKQASSDYSTQSNQAYGQANQDIGAYNANEAKLNSGQNVAANPWQSAGYLANQNRLQSDSLDAAGNSATKSLQDLNARTGGLNAGGTAAATDSLALGKMRLANQLNAGRSAADFDKNVAYQQSQASAPLNAAQAEDPLYGTSTSGRTGANSQLTQIGMQSQNFWNNLALMGIKAGTGAAGGALAGLGSSGNGNLAAGAGA